MKGFGNKFKRFIPAILACCFTFCCLPFPTLAVEDRGFSDVSPEDWFAPYVEVCVEERLMKGTGDGKFEPQRELTWEECALLTLRLYDIMQGGTGDFEPAPKDWGYAVLVLDDVTSLFEGHLTYESDLRWLSLGQHMASSLGFALEDDGRRAWGAGLADQKVALTLDGTVYDGVLRLSTEGDLLCFFPADPEAEYPLYTPVPPAEWCRDGWYYAQQKGLADLLYNSNARWAFAQRIATVTDLPAMNDITGDSIPDLDPKFAAEETLALYRAGILTGVDEAGNFNGSGTLTRAEAAAMLARILRPELRVRMEENI